MKSCDQSPSGAYCVQCEAVMASQDPSRWWCTEVCFEEWQAWRWQAPVTKERSVMAVAAKPV
jgi:hypothetical protein